MSRLKNVKWSRIGVTFMFAFAVLAVQFSGALARVANAANNEVVWTGAGNDLKFSTAANWSSGVVPGNGDILVFNTAPKDPNGGDFLDNDIDATFGGIKTETESTQNLGYYALQKALKLAGNPTVSINQYLTLYPSTEHGIQVDGDYTYTGGLSPGLMNIAGTLTIVSGETGVLPRSAGSIVIQNGAFISCNILGSNTTIPLLTLGGGTGSDAPVLTSACTSGGTGTPEEYTLTINKVVLKNNAYIGIISPQIIKVLELQDNGFTLQRTEGMSGQLITPNGVQENQSKTTALDGDKPDENVTLVDKETGILNGTRGVVGVQMGARLQGNGTVQSLSVASGAVLSPGNSAGTITVLQSLWLGEGSTLTTELFTSKSYDQLIVGEEATSSNPVEIDNATLDLRFVAGGSVEQGDVFTIIDNRSDEPTMGTFAGLEEGARITIGDAVFSISYAGGDGNDVVLIALVSAKAPDAPNTGIAAIIMVNPAIVALVGLLAAAAVAVTVRRAKQ